MKLLRFESPGGPRLGVLRGNAIVGLGDLGIAGSDMIDIIINAAVLLPRITERLDSAPAQIALGQARLLAPIPRPGKYLGIGMNYRDHAAEAERLGLARPQRQMWFNKQTSCISGPYDDIEPGVTEQLDYEVELGVVIGRPAKSVPVERALDHVFGYFVANDVSARDWQFHSNTVTIGKSFDTHGPTGPWIVTADEIPDPQALDLRCLVNGETRQSSNTRLMIHRIDQQIAYLSTAFTLEPGDLLATGTPEGVGIARQPPQFLSPGDVVRCEIDGIGSIENRVAGR